jgi:DNA-binding MarR family transcriptional regulator
VVDALLSASRVFVGLAARSLGDAGEEVTLAQYRTLVVLASLGPQTVASLADALAVTPPTATRMCDRLVAKGLVRRRHERTDRRVVRITLAPAGRRLVDEVTVRRRAELASLLAGMPGSTMTALVDALGSFSAAAGAVPDQDWSAGWEL